jgi:tetratricopeptide (TPR) repeat protein
VQLFWWAGWLAVTAAGIVMTMLRSAEDAFSTVSLPKLLYMMWLMVCVLAFVALRMVWEASIGLAAALAVGAFAFMGGATGSRRREELAERLAGARAALEENPNNALSMELLGDVASTLEEREGALRWYERAYALVPSAGLLEKLEGLRRETPNFFIWGNPCAHELRLCPACEELNARGAYACARCGKAFFGSRLLWRASAFNRFCDDNGLTEILESGLFLLPFLFACGPWAYGFCWLVWAGARRPRGYRAA